MPPLPCLVKHTHLPAVAWGAHPFNVCYVSLLRGDRLQGLADPFEGLLCCTATASYAALCSPPHTKVRRHLEAPVVSAHFYQRTSKSFLQPTNIQSCDHVWASHVRVWGYVQVTCNLNRQRRRHLSSKQRVILRTDANDACVVFCVYVLQYTDFLGPCHPKTNQSASRQLYFSGASAAFEAHTSLIV